MSEAATSAIPLDIIPSVSLEALLGKRDAAMACLQRIRDAADEYQQIAESVGLGAGSRHRQGNRGEAVIACLMCGAPAVDAGTWQFCGQHWAEMKEAWRRSAEAGGAGSPEEMVESALAAAATKHSEADVKP